MMIGGKFILLAGSCCALLLIGFDSLYAQENLLRSSVHRPSVILDSEKPQRGLSESRTRLNQYESHIPDSRLQQSMPANAQATGGTRPTLIDINDNMQPAAVPSIDDINRELGTELEPDAIVTDPILLGNSNMRIGKIGSVEESVERNGLRQTRLQAYGRINPENAYEAECIKLGNFTLRSTLEQGIKATSNADDSDTGKGAIVSQTALQFVLSSDWQRHSGNLDVRGSWDRSVSGEDVSEPEMLINGDITFDLTEQDKLNLELGYTVRRESASDPNSIENVKKRPFYRMFNGSIGIEREQGLFFGEATARFAYHSYEKANLDNGSVLSQRDRDNVQSSLLLRGGYEISASIKPFIEAEYGKRSFRDKYDRNGFERSGDVWALRAGVIIDRGEKLNGEVAIGYLHESLDDPRLKNMGGLSIKGNMNWSPIRGTQVRLGAQTTSEISTTPFDNGSLNYLSELEIIHQLRSNLTLNTKFDLALRDYQNSSEKDWTIGAQIGATYWINKFVALDTRLRYERLYSDVSDREYITKSIYGGIKLQR